MCKLPLCLKIITVSLYITLLFLAKTVTLFLLIIFINELNKAGVFVAEAEPWHTQLQDPGLVWFSTGIGPHLVSYILPLMKCSCPKLKLVVGQCRIVQHFSTAFWPRFFSEGLSGRKGKVTWDGWCLHPFTKKPYLRPTGHDNICSVSDTFLYLQLNWLKKLPKARWNILKSWIFLIWIILAKLCGKSGELRQQTWRGRDNGWQETWWAAWDEQLGRK